MKTQTEQLTEGCRSKMRVPVIMLEYAAKRWKMSSGESRKNFKGFSGNEGSVPRHDEKDVSKFQCRDFRSQEARNPLSWQQNVGGISYRQGAVYPGRGFSSSILK